MALLILWLGLTPLRAADVRSEHWHRAEAAFDRASAGDGGLARAGFAEAAGLYALVRRESGVTPGLAHNEGIAWLLAGDAARAIVSFRRGLRAAPRDSRLRDDLRLARELVRVGGSGPPSPPTGFDPLPPWSVGTWFALLLFAECGACVTLTGFLATRKRGMLVAGVVFVGSGGALVAGLVYPESIGRGPPVVVVTADGVDVYHGNGRSYPTLSRTLNRGAELGLRSVRGSWLQVDLGDGELGWVERRRVFTEED